MFVHDVCTKKGKKHVRKTQCSAMISRTGHQGDRSFRSHYLEGLNDDVTISTW